MTRLLVVLVIAAAVGTLFVFGLRPRDVASPFVGKTLDDWTAPSRERLVDYVTGLAEAQ